MPNITDLAINLWYRLWNHMICHISIKYHPCNMYALSNWCRSFNTLYMWPCNASLTSQPMIPCVFKAVHRSSSVSNDTMYSSLKPIKLTLECYTLVLGQAGWQDGWDEAGFDQVWLWLGELGKRFQCDLCQQKHMRGSESTRYDTEIIQIQQTNHKCPYQLRYIT